jgi:hypothetical protein
LLGATWASGQVHILVIVGLTVHEVVIVPPTKLLEDIKARCQWLPGLQLKTGRTLSTRALISSEANWGRWKVTIPSLLVWRMTLAADGGCWMAEGDWFTGRGFLEEWRNPASAVASRSTSSFTSCEASDEDSPHDLPLVGTASHCAAREESLIISVISMDTPTTVLSDAIIIISTT